MSKREREPRRAPSVQQVVAGPGPAVAADGTTYRLGFNTGDAKGRLEELVRAHVWDRVYAESARMAPAAAARHEARYDSLFGGGHFDTFGRGWQETLTSPAGAVLFLLSLLQEHHPDLTPDDARRLYRTHERQFRRAVGVVAPDFFAAVLRQLGATEGQVAANLPAMTRLAAAWGDETPAPATGSTS